METNALTYSVTEIATAVKRAVEDQFGYVRIRGEISGWKVHSSGHAYLALKDAGAVLDGVCWKGNLARMGFRPEDGLEVVATGKLTTYPGRSKYQIVIDRMEPAGVGALMALLEKRKKMLAAEGLFAPERKQLLPFMPRVIGVVTSPTGAVIRDILHRIADRFPVHVIVWPVLVQGDGAAEQIAAAVRGFNQDASVGFPRPDLIIVARGGGSLEDLWSFNEEIVVRAVAESDIPVISAVGHETDTTLIDFAADVRAPTPTAAAEMAVPVRAEWLFAVEDLGARLRVGMQRDLIRRRENVMALARALPNPRMILLHAAQRVDDWADRLRQSLSVLLQQRRQQLAVLSTALRPQILQRDITHRADRLSQIETRLQRAYVNALALRRQRLETVSRVLESVNYTRVLERGFALVRDASGAVVTRAAGVTPQAELAVSFSDGSVRVKAL